ncbi:MAG: hypothetical protein V4695_10185 [Pseudomonadota bacterium]
MQLSDSLSLLPDAPMVIPRLAVLYAHLLACCVAVGITLAADVAALRRIATGIVIERRHADFQTLQATVSFGLWGLWITGITVVAIDVALQGFIVLSNPKLQGKIAVVSILTINGIFLHRYAIPALTEAGSLLNLAPAVQRRVLAAGVLSGVS